MKQFFSFILLLFVLLLGANAAYLQNVPQTLVQPNGDTLHCFATGDEFYHYLHDAEGFTIVKNPATGFFVYAKSEDGKVVPTDYIAGRVNPAAVGLTPRARISQSEWQLRRERMETPMKALPAGHEPARDVEMNHGTINNLVIFIRFADDDGFTQSYSSVDLMFNDSSSTDVNSMYNFFHKVSYNQLTIKSHLVPVSTDDNIISYQYTAPRNYFMPWSVDNPIGYDDSNENDNRTTREQWLLKCAVEALEDQIPEDVDFDYNDDGLIDNVCFVLTGDVAGWNELLWPHRWSLFAYEAYIHGLRVWDFNFELSDNEWYFSNSTLCHEMSHTLSAPDLYHYADDEGFTPVGGWDLMAQNALVPQHWGVWMKHKYGHWIDDIPVLTESGRYVLYPVASATPERICYRINSEDPNEFFILEYRSTHYTFEHYLPNAGLLIYRINSLFDGNASWNGADILDEVYIYRPGGTLTSDGDLDLAGYSQVLHHPRAINYSTDPQPFLSNGYVSALNICEVRTFSQDSVVFWYLLPGDTIPSEISDQRSEIRLFPNPAVSQLTITNSISPINMVEVFDLNGRCLFVAEPRASECVVNTITWPTGTYIVRLHTDSGISQQKVMVKH